MSEEITVEVVFAAPDTQSLLTVRVAAGASVAEAIERSGIAAKHRDFDLDALATGIWGREVDRSTLLKDGDRIELYRPLSIDPREARRQLALAGRTMREGEDENAG